MKVLHLGAGKIGRGFIGAILNKANCDVCFADVNQSLIDLINQERKYIVHIFDYEKEDISIEGISAVATNSEDFTKQFVEADLVTTAVSMKILPLIAPAIAKGLIARRLHGISRPLNIVACENGIRATSQLKALVCTHLSDEDLDWLKGRVGFADSSVDRIVPLFTPENPLDVAVERFYEWNIDKTQLIGKLPEIANLNLTSNLDAHVERKLFTVNTGHCATAFLGNLMGYISIDECLKNDGLKCLVRKIMHESGDFLCAKFNFDKQSQTDYIALVLKRFSNPFIHDLTSRVGHDPRRKLGPTLYFSYPISMALKYGLPTDNLAIAVAAGMAEKVEGDVQCDEIQDLIQSEGLENAITQITQIANSAVIQQIAVAYKRIQKDGVQTYFTE